jgi:hypothetical protein
MNWQTMESCPKDRAVMMYCPGACQASNDILMGIWLERLQIWELMPYGTIQPTTLFPTMWADIPAGP